MNLIKAIFLVSTGALCPYQVCVTDQDGSVLREKAFKHGGEGLLKYGLLEVPGSSPENIAVAIEVNHGPAVETLLEHGFRVRSVNPKQLDRFRDRFSPSGAMTAGTPACSPRRFAPTAATSAGLSLRIPTSRFSANSIARERNS